MAARHLTAQRLREVLDYNPDTGVFTWTRPSGRRVKAGSVAGSPGGYGCVYIGIDAGKYKAHRLVWLYVHGAWPSGHIDHIDGNPTNNRIANLRDVSRATNMQNMKRGHVDSFTGLLGVHKKRGRFVARIYANNTNHRIGSFKTAEEAHAAYIEAKRRLHAGCTI